MTRGPRRSLLALCAASMLLALGAASAQAAQVEAPSNQLQVWNLNTHGMDTATVAGSGRTNYRYFLDYITDSTRVAYYPDILTLQEAGTASLGLRSCHDVENYLQTRTGRDYYCVETTRDGGAAIVYNTDRLSRQSDGQSVQIYKIDQTGADAGGCDLSNWYTGTLRLKDDVNTTKYVNVESVHLPTDNYPADSQSGWATDCAWNNMQITSPAVTGLGSASMQVMAGDWNHTDANATGTNNNTFGSWECWYQAVNTPDLNGCLNDSWGWKDAMYRACLSSTDAATYSCLHTYAWTRHGTNNVRIDFLFAKAYAIANQQTVAYAFAYAAAGSPAGAPQEYSDHQGMGALLKYY